MSEFLLHVVYTFGVFFREKCKLRQCHRVNPKYAGREIGFGDYCHLDTNSSDVREILDNNYCDISNNDNDFQSSSISIARVEDVPDRTTDSRCEQETSTSHAAH